MPTAILEFITSKLFLWGMGALLILAGAWVLASKNNDKALVNSGEKTGAASAVVAGQTSTLEQVRTANEAEANLRSGRSDVAYQQCLRDSAPGYESSCARYKPE